MSVVTMRAKIQYATLVLSYLYSCDEPGPTQMSQFDKNSSHLVESESWLLTRCALETTLLVIEALLSWANLMSHL